MKRRQWLQWGCAHCAVLSGLAGAQGDWEPPPRFTRPDVASDEGGLWALMDREEARLRRSPFRMRDEPMNAYLGDLACRLGADHCPDIRVYLMRTPYFNASMAPNGMMQVWSGLLLRMDNEAQLAAILAHEIGHYLRRHSVEQLRDAKARAAFSTAMLALGVYGLIGQVIALGGAYAFSRDQEREADQISIYLMRRTEHDPREAARVWANLLDELKANPAADPTHDSVLFATHPPSDERRVELERLGADGGGRTGAAAYRSQLAPLRFRLLEDEIQRGRFDESLVLFNRLLAQEPGQAELLYFRGEARRLRGAAGDETLALSDYQAAIATGRAPAQAHRALGTMYRSTRQTEAAREAWQRYLEAAPEAPDAALIRQSLEEMK
jgi:tetratricopeptide (TPR) repeat protein